MMKGKIRAWHFRARPELGTSEGVATRLLLPPPTLLTPQPPLLPVLPFTGGESSLQKALGRNRLLLLLSLVSPIPGPQSGRGPSNRVPREHPASVQTLALPGWAGSYRECTQYRHQPRSLHGGAEGTLTSSPAPPAGVLSSRFCTCPSEPACPLPAPGVTW